MELGDPLVILTSADYDALIDRLGRARLLAAKLEEVVAMRTSVVRALVELPPGFSGQQWWALREWAEAQLLEVP